MLVSIWPYVITATIMSGIGLAMALWALLAVTNGIDMEEPQCDTSDDAHYVPRQPR